MVALAVHRGTAFLVSLVLAFLATLYPSWRASRLQPAEALIALKSITDQNLPFVFVAAGPNGFARLTLPTSAADRAASQVGRLNDRLVEATEAMAAPSGELWERAIAITW